MFIPLFLLLVLSWSAVQGAVVPRSHIIHEKRDSPPLQWAKRDKISSNATLPVRIGLKQRNLDKIDAHLMAVSHPRSSSYGKHWTSDEVIQMFAPSENTVAAVQGWLINNGISGDRITHSGNQGWLAFEATAEEMETLLYTQYYLYEHKETGDVTIACDAYHMPRRIKNHVDYVTPGLRLIPRSSPSSHKTRRSNSLARNIIAERRLDQVNPTANDLDQCYAEVGPACIAALYNIPPGNLSDPSNAMGIFELVDRYAQEDLDLFFKNLALQIPQGTAPKPAFIDGAQAPVPVGQGGVESPLDFQLAYPILWPQGTVLFQTDNFTPPADVTKMGLFNDFLDAIDGSYCTFSAYGETGNDPHLDPVYPAPGNGYKGKLQCGVYKPTNVVSISYGTGEADLPAYYQRRQCLEFAKLALQGVSIIFASGDSGVADRRDKCLGGENVIFIPTFPANCPYVTSVGATEISPGNTVHDPEVAAKVVALFNGTFLAAYSSGGGFSNLYGTPSYQKDAVNFFFKNYNPQYPYYSTNGTIPMNTGVYNRIGRGIPDVSANGLNISTYVRGKPFLSGGTSASAPIFASIINRINEERIARGKGPVGFVNPVLYQHPEILNDITSGNNPGCGTDGFYAVPGWDPVTGLGTPNYPKMLELFLSLA